MEESDLSQEPHPLDGTDERECYEIMMQERSSLVAAKRDMEDTLVKSVIQMSSALMAVLTGFVVQTNVIETNRDLVFLFVVSAGFCFSIILGLLEHWLSSIAYGQQIKKVEEFYTRKIKDLSTPTASKWVRISQISSFVCFMIAVLSLGIFAVLEAEGKIHGTNPAPDIATATAKTPAQPRAGQIGRAREVDTSVGTPATTQTR